MTIYLTSLLDCLMPDVYKFLLGIFASSL